MKAITKAHIAQSYDRTASNLRSRGRAAITTLQHKIDQLGRAVLGVNRPSIGVTIARIAAFLAGSLVLCANSQPVMNNPAFAISPGVSVGALPVIRSVSLQIATSGSLSAVQVLTQGLPNQDYLLSSPSSCVAGNSYLAGQTCSVSVSFSPKYPGLRLGAVVLSAADGTVLASRTLYGTGLGGSATVVPANLTTVAGNGKWIYGGDGMLAISAPIFLPMGGAADSVGNIFISDSGNQRIRRVDASTSNISTFAGSGTPGFTGDNGPASAAMLNTPTDVKLDGAGNLYIADSGNHVVRMITAATGVITTIAGVGGQQGYSGDGGSARLAHLASPGGLALDGNHSLYISDTSNNVIRRVDLLTGLITTVAGNGTPGYGGDGGSALSALINHPWQIALGSDGSLFIADLSNNRIRKVDASGFISTVAGDGTNGYGGDNGPATLAHLNVPAGVAVDVAGNVLIADSGNSLVRKVNAATGIISAYAGTLSGYSDATIGYVNRSILDGPYALFLDGPGNLYVSDMFHQTVRQVAATAIDLFYPTMKEGKISAPRPVFVENDGNGPLSLFAVQPALYSAVDQATTTCSASLVLSIGRTCTVGAQMAPTTTGNYLIGSLLIPSDAANSAITVKLLSQVLSVDPTAATLTSNINPAPLGGSVTFTATVVSGGTFTPTGTFVFLDGSTQIGLGTLNNSGVAILVTSALSTGVHTITALYSGDEQNASSTSPSITEQIKQATGVSLVSSSNPSTITNTITFDAIVSGTNGNGVIPTGTVAFFDGAAQIGIGNLDNAGSASSSTNLLGGGTHTITAVFSGDSVSSGSQSPPLTQVVLPAPTSITLTASIRTVFAGQNVSFTVAVSRSGGWIPAGSVNLLDGSLTLGTTTLDGAGSGNFQLSSLSPGVHSITAVYAGNLNNAASTSNAMSETVQQIPTATSLQSTLNPASAGAAVSLVATVSSSIGGGPGGAPLNGVQYAGTVTFQEGSIVLGASAVSASGIAILNISTLHVGQHSIAGHFNGSTNYAVSMSAALVQTVNLSQTTTLISSNASPSIAGVPVVLNAAVLAPNGTPTGTVTFTERGTSLGLATLTTLGSATFTLQNLAVGSHILTGAYGGDGSDAASTSSSLIQTVIPAKTTCGVTSSAAPSLIGSSLTFTAAIATNGSTVSGPVDFYDGAALLGSGVLTAGSAALATSGLTLGLHTITARYLGDANNLGCLSAPVSQSVLQVVTASLASNANPSMAQSPIIFTVVVTGPPGGQLSGAVTIRDVGNVVGNGSTNSAGVAMVSISSLSTGTHQITAVYAGNSTTQAATSNIVVEVVNPLSTSVVTTSNTNPTFANRPLSLLATVSTQGQTVTGSIIFQDGPTVLGVAVLNTAGVATLIASNLTPGLHQIVAVYSGDANNLPSTSLAISELVTQQVSVKLASGTNPSLALDAVVFTAITSNDTGVAPTGSVTFTDGSTLLGSVLLDASGQASISVSSLPVGTHTIFAAYGGNAVNVSSTSTGITQLIQFRPTSIALTMSATSLSGGQQVTLIAVVHSVGPVSPTGSVRFFSNGIVIANAPLDNAGISTVTIIQTSIAPITATYSGDSFYAGSASDPTNITAPKPNQLTIQLDPSSITLASKQHSTTTITLTSLNGFSDTITLGCLGLPFAATCTFSKDRTPLASNGSQSIQLVVDTGAPLGAGPQARLRQSSSELLVRVAFLPGIGLICLLSPRRTRRRLRGLLAVLMLAGAFGVSGCGGLQINGTLPGTYVFQVTASGIGTGVVQSANMTLTVTQ